MKQLAIMPPKPVSTVETAKGVSARVMPHDVINDVQAPRWFQVGNGLTHAFLLPSGDVPEGSLRAACPLSADSTRFGPAGPKRCKTCVKRMAEDTRKRGTGLSEPVLPVVDKGATAAPVIGARDGRAHMDGPALVKGPNMAPVQRTWRNPVTKEVEPAAAYLGGSLRDRMDKEVAPRPKPKWTNAQKRKFRARQTAERHIAKRRLGVPDVSSAQRDPVAAEMAVLREVGKGLPSRGW